MCGDRLDRGLDLAGTGHRVTGGDAGAGGGELGEHLFGDALDARPAGDECARVAALGTGGGRAAFVAAVVADQPSAIAMLDQPRGASRAAQLVTACLAERERCKAAAVQEQERLLALGQGLGDGRAERGREILSCLCLFLAHVDQRGLGQPRGPVAFGQAQPGVAALPGVDPGLERGRGRAQNHGTGFHAGANHRHVAGVVDDALVLLEGGVVFLVHHDETQLSEREEKGRACANDHAHVTGCHAAPDAAALSLGQVGVPLGWPGAEAAREAVEELNGERDFGQEYERLRTAHEGGCDGFKIGLGLA